MHQYIEQEDRVTLVCYMARQEQKLFQICGWSKDRCVVMHTSYCVRSNQTSSLSCYRHWDIYIRLSMCFSSCTVDLCIHKTGKKHSTGLAFQFLHAFAHSHMLPGWSSFEGYACNHLTNSWQLGLISRSKACLICIMFSLFSLAIYTMYTFSPHHSWPHKNVAHFSVPVRSPSNEL